jgi:hypothetical protein
MSKNDDILNDVLSKLPAEQAAEIKAEAEASMQDKDYHPDKEASDLLLGQMEQDQEN